MRKIASFCKYLLVKESSSCGSPCLKGVFKTGIVSSVAKSDEIGKIAISHFLLRSWGLTYWKNSLQTLFNVIPVLKTPFKHRELSLTRRYTEKLTLFNKESLHQLSLMTKSHEISFKNHVTIVITNQTPLNCQIL